MAERYYVLADEPLELAEGATTTLAGKPLAVDFTAVLGDATISSVTSVTVTPSGSLTVDESSVNSSTYQNKDGNTVAIGKAVLLALSGQTRDDSVYVMRLTVTDSDGERQVGEVKVDVQ